MSTPTRTYRGRAVDELIPRIQAELGAEAIIVRRREGLTGGVLGFFQHPFVELEAMPGGPRIDIYDEPEAVAPDLLSIAQPAAAPPPPAPAPARPPSRPSAPRPFQTGEPAGAPDYGSANVTAHLAALARADRAAIGSRAVPYERPAEPPPALRPPEPSPALLVPERRTVAPGSGARARAGVEKSLFRVGIGEQLAGELIDGAAAHTLALAPRSGLAQAVRTTLAQRIPVAAPLPVKGAAIVLVGAGGSGKTTCCAALLAAYRSNSTLRASFATVTREQGELQMMLAPQVMKPAPIASPRAQRALRRARADGLLVLDTPRLSPIDRGAIRDMARLLGELRADRVLVALPATLGAKAAAQLLEALAPLGADALAVTHAEETDQLGVAVEAACAFGLAPELLLDHGRAGAWRLTRIDPTGLAAKLLP